MLHYFLFKSWTTNTITIPLCTSLMLRMNMMMTTWIITWCLSFCWQHSVAKQVQVTFPLWEKWSCFQQCLMLQRCNTKACLFKKAYQKLHWAEYNKLSRITLITASLQLPLLGWPYIQELLLSSFNQLYVFFLANILSFPKSTSGFFPSSVVLWEGFPHSVGVANWTTSIHQHAPAIWTLEAY